MGAGPGPHSSAPRVRRAGAEPRPASGGPGREGGGRWGARAARGGEGSCSRRAAAGTGCTSRYRRLRCQGRPRRRGGGGGGGGDGQAGTTVRRAPMLH
jgi:hypothetical protein